MVLDLLHLEGHAAAEQKVVSKPILRSLSGRVMALNMNFCKVYMLDLPKMEFQTSNWPRWRVTLQRPPKVRRQDSKLFLQDTASGFINFKQQLFLSFKPSLHPVQPMNPNSSPSPSGDTYYCVAQSGVITMSCQQSDCKAQPGVLRSSRLTLQSHLISKQRHQPGQLEKMIASLTCRVLLQLAHPEPQAMLSHLAYAKWQPACHCWRPPVRSEEIFSLRVQKLMQRYKKL